MKNNFLAGTGSKLFCCRCMIARFTKGHAFQIRNLVAANDESPGV
jgi:hypothetical protein